MLPLNFLYLRACTLAHAFLPGFQNRAEARRAPAFHPWARFALGYRGMLGWPLLAAELRSDHSGPKPGPQTEARTNKGKYAGDPPWQPQVINAILQALCVCY